jgi:hypothetical protein
MEDLTLDHLKDLSLQSAATAISIFMPTHRAGPDTRQDPIRFKNLVQDARQRLLDRGMGPRPVEALLAPVQRLVEDYHFWQHQREGLAVFLTEDDFHYHRLPFEVSELLVLSRSYYVKPVLPLFTNNGHYYLLALSQDETRLFEGTRHTVGELDMPEDAPDSMADMPGAASEKQAPFSFPSRWESTGAAFRGGGSGTGDEYEKMRIGRYLNKVDRALSELYANWTAPLVLAGVEYLLPIYRENSEYRNIMDEGITGSPEHLRAEELHALAWPIVEPYFRSETEAAIGDYGQSAAAGTATDDLAAVVEAANLGRVKTLMLAIDAPAWGKYDAETGKVLHVQAEQSAEDDLALLDYTAMKVLRKDGAVFVLPQEEMPTASPVAAVLRW